MALPAWPPPLISHENSTIDVVTYEDLAPYYFQTLRTDVNEIQGNFYIKLHVSVSFYSDDDVEKKMEFLGLSVRIIEPINAKNPELLSTSLREIILNEEMIPVQLEDFYYREYHLHGGFSSRFLISNRIQLIEKLWNFILSVDQKPENADREPIGVNVDIHIAVVVPDEKFEPWIFWYDEQKRLYPDFEKEYYKRGLSMLQDQDEVLDEAVLLMWRISTRRTIVRGLESAMADENDDEVGDSSVERLCSICLEEFHGRVHATRLPCRHVFHKNCIARWLVGNYVCPLCRHRVVVD